MFLEDVVAVTDILAIVDSIKIITEGEYAYCIRENSTLTSKWTLKKSTDELDAILHVYDFVCKEAPESPQQYTTFWWIVYMLTSIKSQFGVNYLRENPDINVRIPPLDKSTPYKLIRHCLIKSIGLKRYIDFVTNISKLIHK